MKGADSQRGWLRRAAKKVGDWSNDVIGLFPLLGKIARHPVPPNTGWMYIFGSATLVAFLLQVATGIALANSYVPSASQAYESLQYISHQAFWGKFLRSMHYFGASAMVVLVGIHALRVFLTASYKYPRVVSWLSGVVLLLATLGMGFTGQLLRWDQNGVWSIVVATEQVGRVPWIGKYLAHIVLAGDVVSGVTLSRFFSLHVFLLTALIFALLGLHLFLVVRNGISEPPVAGRPVEKGTYREAYDRMLQREGKPFWPHAAWRDVIAALLVIGVVMVLAGIVGAPMLLGPPDPANLNADPRPDWYLLWYFAALALIPPSIEDYVIVGGPVVFVIVLIAIPLVSSYGERSPRARPWAPLAALAVVTTIVAFTIMGYRSPWSPDFEAKPLSASIIGATRGPVYQGGKLFYDRGCEYCHEISGHGGHRGPVLTYIGDRLTRAEMTIRILNGKGNMPAFADIVDPGELRDLLDFLQTRKRQRSDTTTQKGPAAAR